MGSSRRDLSNDMAKHRFIVKNNENTYHPRFGFKPKTGIAFPKTGFCFNCELSIGKVIYRGIFRNNHTFLPYLRTHKRMRLTGVYFYSVSCLAPFSFSPAYWRKVKHKRTSYTNWQRPNPWACDGIYDIYVAQVFVHLVAVFQPLVLFCRRHEDRQSVLTDAH